MQSRRVIRRRLQIADNPCFYRGIERDFADENPCYDRLHVQDGVRMMGWLRRIFAHKRDRRAAISAGSGVGQRTVQMASTIVLMPILVHALGTAQFGIWGAATSLAWLNNVADFGTGLALVTLVARSLAQEKVQEARRQVAGALTLGSALACFFLLLVAAIWAFGGWRGNGAVYLIAFAGLALNLPVNSAAFIWMALQEGYVSSFWETVQTVATTAALIGATSYTQDVRIFVAIVYGGLVLSNLGSLIHLFISHPELLPDRFPERWAATQDVVSSGFMFFLMGIAGSLTFMLDNVLALQLLGPEVSAQMTIAVRICFASMSMLGVIAQPLWPAFTDAAHRSDRGWVLHRLIWGTVLVTGVAIVGSTILIVWGEPLLRWWLRGNLRFGAGLLWAVAIWVPVQALLRVPHLLLNAVLLIRFQTVIFALTSAVALALKFLFARWMGVAGILWATSLSILLLTFPVLLWRISRWLHQLPCSETSRVQFSDYPEIGR